MALLHSIRPGFRIGYFRHPRGRERVETSAGIQASLAGRYASALFDLASEAGTVTAVESDLDKLEAGLSESTELALLTTSPKVSRDAAKKSLWGVSAIMGLSELTQNFLGTLAQNRRLSKLPAIIRSFRAIAAAQRGEVSAEVASAHALTDSQLDQLKAKLTAREGRTVKLTTKVDPDLLGGLVVTIGSKRIDGSIRTRLNSLSQAMKA
jgi:F-type H+-transporting ATPase subunit delta